MVTFRKQYLKREIENRDRTARRRFPRYTWTRAIATNTTPPSSVGCAKTRSRIQRVTRGSSYASLAWVSFSTKPEVGRSSAFATRSSFGNPTLLPAAQDDNHSNFNNNILRGGLSLFVQHLSSTKGGPSSTWTVLRTTICKKQTADWYVAQEGCRELDREQRCRRTSRNDQKPAHYTRSQA